MSVLRANPSNNCSCNSSNLTGVRLNVVPQGTITRSHEHAALFKDQQQLSAQLTNEHIKHGQLLENDGQVQRGVKLTNMPTLLSHMNDAGLSFQAVYSGHGAVPVCAELTRDDLVNACLNNEHSVEAPLGNGTFCLSAKNNSISHITFVPPE